MQMCLSELKERCKAHFPEFCLVNLGAECPLFRLVERQANKKTRHFGAPIRSIFWAADTCDRGKRESLRGPRIQNRQVQVIQDAIDKLQKKQKDLPPPPPA